MIELTKLERTIRETTAEFQISKDGVVSFQTIRIQYYSPTIADLKKAASDAEAKFKNDPAAIFWLSETLAAKIHALPDLTSKGKPAKITAELLETIDLLNLRAIDDAITEHMSPKSKPD